MVSTEELHRSIAWAYKWLRRFDKEGLEGLKNKPRSSGLTSRCTPKEAIKDKN
jgi:transposase